MTLHPDDPPRPLFGLPRIAATRTISALHRWRCQSTANGITFCTGSLGAGAKRRPGDGEAVRAARSSSPICATSPRRPTARSWRPTISAATSTWSRWSGAAHREPQAFIARPDRVPRITAIVCSTISRKPSGTNPGPADTGRVKHRSRLRGKNIHLNCARSGTEVPFHRTRRADSARGDDVRGDAAPAWQPRTPPAARRICRWRGRPRDDGGDG